MIDDHISHSESRPLSSPVRHRFTAPDGWQLCSECGSIRNSNQHHELPEGWEPIETAPKNATNIEVIMMDGSEQLMAHWAEDMSGEDQPSFRGWFVKLAEGPSAYFHEIDTPDGWRPIPRNK